MQFYVGEGPKTDTPESQRQTSGTPAQRTEP
jgi:hypothetical protein